MIELLKEHAWKISTVESCTGGMIASSLVDVPGASDVLEEAFVTYCDRAKQELVGVSRNTLEKYTAVSSECCREMAFGGADRAGADVCLSATGYAGPDGTPEEPAGLVYVGCTVHGKTEVKELHLFGGRNEVRRQAADEALELALNMIEQEVKEGRRL
ncbi:MAG: CinA family protein [Eubacterium sp.]|nr:CinA family protein [Eubacterium sp.]